MKYRTQADLDAFLCALRALQGDMSDQLAQNGATVAIVKAQDREKAVEVGFQSFDEAAARFEETGRLFELQAIRMLGEARRPGEAVQDYTARIARLALDPLAAMRRAGIMLMPW